MKSTPCACLWYVLLLLLFPFIGHGQTHMARVAQVDGFYFRSNLHKVLRATQIRHPGLRMQYDSAAFAKYEVNERVFAKPLMEFLDPYVKRYKLEVKFDSTGTLVLASKVVPGVVAAKVDASPKANQPAGGGGKPTAPATSSKQNFPFTGRVLAQESGEALPFASVLVRGTQLTALTNADGYFSFAKMPSDTSVLQISYIGYKPGLYALTPQMPLTGVQFELEPFQQTTETIELVDDREALVKVPDQLGAIQLSPKQVAQLPSVGERDVMRSLQLMPGVSSSFENSAGLYVRGGTPDQNLILYDGFTVYHVDHLYGFFSAFNSNGIKSLTMYKGGFDARFGGRLSSVMEIVGKDGNQKQFNMGADISLLSFNIYAETPIGDKMTAFIAARRSYQGLLYDKIFKSFQNQNTSSRSGPGGGGGPGGGLQQQSRVSSYFYDINSKVVYRPTERDVIAFSFYNGTDKLDNSLKFESGGGGFGGGGGAPQGFSIGNTDVTRFGNIGASLKGSRKWSRTFYQNVLASVSNYYSTRDRSTAGNFTDSQGNDRSFRDGVLEDNSLIDLALKADNQWTYAPNHYLSFGAQVNRFDIAYSYAENDTSTVLDRQSSGSLVALYASDQIGLFSNRLTLTPGIRLNYFTPTSKWYNEPRFASSLALTDRLSLKTATGLYYQFANRIIREDVLSGSRDFWLLANGSSIPVASAVHYMAGLHYDTQDYMFSVEGYRKNLTGITEYNLRLNSSPQGTSYQENLYSGIGYSRGVEFMVQKKYGKFTGWTSYTLGEAKNKIDVYGTEYFAAAQDIRHDFKVAGIYKHKRWLFSATWMYASGRSYTAPEGGYKLTLVDGTEQEYIIVGAKNALRMPDYHRLDVAVNYSIFGAEQREIGYIGFSLFNLYDRKNLWYKQYTIVDNTLISNNVNYLGITPNLTLSLRLR